jgi:hypothetical protein
LLNFHRFLGMYTSMQSELGSSVSIVPGNRLDDRAIEVRSPAEAKGFTSSLSVQTGSGANPDSCTMGTGGGPFPRAKARPGLDGDHSPHVVPRSRMSRSYTLSPPSASVACSGTALAFLDIPENCPLSPSICMKQPESSWMDFHEIWYLGVLLKFVSALQFWLKSDRYDGHFT